jgi:hypothetical protein
MSMALESVITCPECGVSKAETMPVDACQFYYDCTSCGALLRRKTGDCCVFCSYGSVPCPPKQEAACENSAGGDPMKRPSKGDDP